MNMKPRAHFFIEEDGTLLDITAAHVGLPIGLVAAGKMVALEEAALSLRAITGISGDQAQRVASSFGAEATHAIARRIAETDCDLSDLLKVLQIGTDTQRGRTQTPKRDTSQQRAKQGPTRCRHCKQPTRGKQCACRNRKHIQKR